MDSGEKSVAAEDRMRLLEAVAGTVFGSRSVGEILTTHAKHVCQVLDVPMCVIRKLEGDQLRLLACHGVPTEYLQEFVSSDLGLGKRLIAEKQPIGITDVNVHPDSAPHIKDGQPMRYSSYAGTPLVVDEEVVGILGIFVTDEPRVFPQDDLNLLYALGSNFAVAIKNHEQYLEFGRLNDELDERVRSRTAELEAANRELEAFTYTVAHDLRTPLRSIVSNAQILLQDFGESIPLEAKPMLARQADSAKRLAAMMDGLLALTRIGKHNVQKVHLNVSRLAEEVALEFIRAHSDHPPEFTIEPDIVLGADSRLLRLLFQNLFENSIKFAKEGERAKIRVKTDSNDPTVGFIVEDQGIGFEMEYAAKVFQPFERLVREEEYPGHGIGLASVKRIVDKHRGTVEAASRSGQGTAFIFRL